jgi:hypothetical protein
MAYELDCADCDETFREDTVEGVLKAAAAHHHQHHGAPPSMTPELEQALRAAVRTV